MCVDDRLPVNLLSGWSDALEAFFSWEKANARIDAFDVVTDVDLRKFFNQKHIPGACIAVLMQYDAGARKDPVQWPRITSRTILDVFRRLEKADTDEIQGDLLSLLAATQESYQSWVDVQWKRFDFRCKLDDLPEVPASQRGFLHLESDLWDRGPGFKPASPISKAATATMPPPTVSTLAEKRSFARVAQDEIPQAKVGPPDEQRTARPKPCFGPHVERLLQMYGGNAQAVDSLLMRQMVLKDEEISKANGDEAGVIRNPMCSNIPVTRPKGVTFQANLDVGRGTPQNANSNTLPDIINVDETSEPSTSESQRLMTELRRINEAVKALAATQSQNENAGRTIALEQINLRMPNNSPTTNTGRGRTRRQRSRSADSSESRSRSRSRSKNRSHKNKPRTASEERTYTESAHIVDPKGPLPVNNTPEAAGDYLTYNTPFLQSREYKAFKDNCSVYVENGTVSWEQWTFDVRTKCKRMNMSYDQTWRLATTLLPLNLQGVIYKEIMRSDFVGLCWLSWKQLAGKAAEKMEPVERAKQEMATMSFHKDEPVHEFIHRFQLVAARATAASCSMSQSLRPTQIFTY